MAEFSISEVSAGAGRLALCPMPGRAGAYAADLDTLLRWRPALVVTLATAEELAVNGASRLSADLAAAGVGWRHLPVPDFAAESVALMRDWRGVSAEARTRLDEGGGVLFHCLGGCGRSGMAAMRLMVELGEAPDAALARLRRVRPCAVETEAQRAWAARGQSR